MLEFIRKRATGWVAWGIVIFISIPFALWGINEYFTPVSNLSVAKVNGQEIALGEFRQAFQQQRNQLQRLLGPQLATTIDDERVRRETLDQLINDELVLQAAGNAGLRIGDAQLAGAIQSQQTFGGDGGFSQAQYEGWLRSQGYSPGGFEQLMRRNLLSGQVVNGLMRSSFATDVELSRVRELQGQQRTFKRLVIPAQQFADVEVSDEEVAAHYEEQKSRYARAEQITVEYIELSRSDIAAGIEIDDSELRRVYETREANFVTPEQRQVSHILLNLGMDASEEATRETEEKLVDIGRQIEAGASFEEMAKQHSEDPGTARNGGALGFIGKGVMDPDFETAAFALGKGEVSQPVRTRFGFHLVKVNDIRTSSTRTFEDVVVQLRTEYQAEQADQEFSEQIEQLATVVFEHPESLELAVETLGVETKISELFTRAGGGSVLAANPKVVEVAFSLDVLQDGNNSEVIELSDGVVVALRVKDHEPRTSLSLGEVKDRIVDELRQAAARSAIIEIGNELVGDLANGKSLGSASTLANAEWSEAQTVARNANGLEPQTSARLFRMPRPKDGKATYTGDLLPNGDFQILALESISAAPSEADADSAKAMRQSLATAYGSTLLEEYIRSLRDDADVVINQENLLGSL
jgi:peptidyl-prolyl cis-trans isomerase D